MSTSAAAHAFALNKALTPDLKAAQAEFEKTVSDKAAVESQQDIPPVRASRSQLADHVETLVGCVKVLHQFAERDDAESDLDNLNSLVGTLNEVITEVTSVARARRTRETTLSEAQPELEPAGA